MRKLKPPKPKPKTFIQKLREGYLRAMKNIEEGKYNNDEEKKKPDAKDQSEEKPPAANSMIERFRELNSNSYEHKE